MNRGIQGLKVSQASLILIGLVCVTVLALAWTNTTFFASLFPSQSRVLQLYLGSSETSERNNSSLQAGTKEVESPGSLQIEPSVKSGNTENVTSDKGGVVSPPAAQGKRGPEEVSGGKNKSREREIESSAESPVVFSVTTGKKDCNYGKGKWFFDDNWPLYSGEGCKQWLSPMWACRRTQRPDFQYERFRWQPKDCKMEAFTGDKFLQRMQNKTLAFVGDSLGREQFQSLMCMVTGGKESPDVLNVGYEYGLVKARGAVRPDGWAYRFPNTNTTILYYWSASLCDLEPINASNPVTDVAMHLDRPPAFLGRFLPKFDVLVLNTGHHWNKGKLESNRWVIHIGGVPNTEGKIASVEDAKNFTLHSIVKWVNSQLSSLPGHKAFLRSLAPRHFFNGDWNSGGTCNNTIPLSHGSQVVQDNSSDPFPADAVRGSNVTLLDITALSQLRDEAHVSRYGVRGITETQDCLHWCLPGVPDTWNEILFAQL